MCLALIKQNYDKVMCDIFRVYLHKLGEVKSICYDIGRFLPGVHSSILLTL